jgi:hypothetical protein
MSNHLSEDQFDACVLERAGRVELEHLGECAECRVELERFRRGLALYRSAVWGLVEDRDALPVADVTASMPAPIPIWRWALAITAFVFAIVTPIIVTENKLPQKAEQMSPAEVMERMNRHLSRTVPAPMEPMMSLISNDQLVNERGGVQ